VLAGEADLTADALGLSALAVDPGGALS